MIRSTYQVSSVRGEATYVGVWCVLNYRLHWQKKLGSFAIEGLL